MLGLVLMVATGVGIGIPLGALAGPPATISYDTCPDFTTFQNDILSITGVGTITFNVADCTIQATSNTLTAPTSSVTIEGNGLTLTGGTADTPGSFDLLSVGPSGSLELDSTTLAYGNDGIMAATQNAKAVTLKDSTIRNNASNGIVASATGIVVSLTDSSIVDNGTDGIFGTLATLQLTGSTVSGNGSGGICEHARIGDDHQQHHQQ